MPFTPTTEADLIWRDYTVDGVPSSGKHSPVKGDIRTWGTEVEEALGNVNGEFDDVNLTAKFLQVDNGAGGGSAVAVNSEEAYSAAYQFKVDGVKRWAWERKATEADRVQINAYDGSAVFDKTLLDLYASGTTQMYGPLILKPLTGQSILNLNSVDNDSLINFQDNNVVRWSLNREESASNEFQLNRYDASGVYQDTPFKVATSGNLTAKGAFTVEAQAGYAWLQIRRGNDSDHAMLRFLQANGNVRWSWHYNADGAMKLHHYDSGGVFESVPIIVDDDNTVKLPTAYTSTTASAVNLNIASSGLLSRSTSSGEFKTNLQTIPNAQEAILALNPVSFESLHEIDLGRRFMGFIAEEVIDVIPEASLDDNQNYDVRAIVAAQTKVIQEMLFEIEILKDRVRELENSI